MWEVSYHCNLLSDGIILLNMVENDCSRLSCGVNTLSYRFDARKVRERSSMIERGI
jgi:hypothetical protein